MTNRVEGREDPGAGASVIGYWRWVEEGALFGAGKLQCDLLIINE